MSRKTGNKWKTDECGRCGESHSGYSGKLDKDGIEYVVCGRTHKRMDVANEIIGGENKMKELKNKIVFATIWIKE